MKETMFNFIGKIMVALMTCGFAIAPTSVALHLTGASDAVVIFVPVIGAFTGKFGLDAFEWTVKENKND